MRIKQPSLTDMLEQAQAAQAGRVPALLAQYGRRRAVLQCHHGGQRSNVGEVRGHVVIGTTWPHDLMHANYDIPVRCKKCPGETGLRILDLPKIRAALRAPHTGVLKLNVDDVSRRVEQGGEDSNF